MWKCKEIKDDALQLGASLLAETVSLSSLPPQSRLQFFFFQAFWDTNIYYREDTAQDHHLFWWKQVWTSDSGPVTTVTAKIKKNNDKNSDAIKKKLKGFWN